MPDPTPDPTPEAVVEVDLGLLSARIRRHFEAQDLIDSEVQVQVLGVVESEMPPLQRGRMRLWKGEEEQEVDFLATSDGRWFLRADPVDLTVDPVAQALAAISVGPQEVSIGPEDAPITIVEYSDYQCPFCARAETMVHEELLKDYGERVRFVFKHLPLVALHPWAQTASEIGLCVLRQAGGEVYWKYHREVFAHQREIAPEKATERLLGLAGEAGADTKAIRACEEADETLAIIEATVAEADALGVKATPTFFVNGRRLSGAQPIDAFRAVIATQLAAEDYARNSP